MKRHFADWNEQALDLAIDRFTVGLDDGDLAALDRLTNDVDLQEFENTVAAIHLGALGGVQPMPTEVLDRLERAGREHVRASSEAAPPRPVQARTRRMGVLALGGWLAAAALLLMFSLGKQERDVDTFALREMLMADASDILRIEWTPTDDPAATRASGDVVWSSSRQEGYLRFQNLEANDPQQSQYQLWIFDPTRADWEAKPVDGGVFDITANGEVIVPIDAKLAARETALFAVTIEVPGGVVVSERERLVLTAAL